jgi:TATA-box binding protein (TBP) (component of TFIID and TFIIIB)
MFYEDDIDLAIENHFQFKGKENIPLKIPSPTELRISTMTGVASISTSVNLQVVGKYLKTVYDDDDKNNKIVYMAHGDRERGIHPKNKKNKKNKKPFYNQATLIIKLDENKHVNLKVFVNGNLQVTGLKSLNDGKLIIDVLIDALLKTEGITETKENSEITEQYQKAIKNPENINIKDFEIMLINSDYFCGYKLEREILYKLMIKEYGLFSTFEPCIYPGVNIKYYWNSKNQDKNFPGVCQCSVKCNGKGDGSGNGKCKKITVSAFQSGNVIITGARNTDQINITYNFINSVFKKHYKELKKNDIPDFDSFCFSDDSDTEMPEKKRKRPKHKVIMIKRSKIKKRNISNYIEHPLL